jgi:ABC-type multidrug transport system ATPase subunit
MHNQTIQVKGQQKSRKQLQVLKSLDFEMEKGSIFALLGSTGAGGDATSDQWHRGQAYLSELPTSCG